MISFEFPDFPSLTRNAPFGHSCWLQEKVAEAGSTWRGIPLPLTHFPSQDGSGVTAFGRESASPRAPHRHAPPRPGLRSPYIKQTPTAHIQASRRLDSARPSPAGAFWDL